MRITLTGTGTPRPSGSRAGPGVLVESGLTRIQIDAGRGTLMRLASLGVAAGDLSALCLTHHHSDHTVDVPDVLMTRWILGSEDPLVVLVPRGPLEMLVTQALLPWMSDLEARAGQAKRDMPPEPELVPFDASPDPGLVGSVGSLQISAVHVRHDPIRPAVAYRLENERGAVVISGDTVACREVEQLADGADVLVHEAMLGSQVRAGRNQFIRDYHAEVREVGALARNAGVKGLILTHLIPEPRTPSDISQFEEEVRAGGFDGTLRVGQDLLSVEVSTGGDLELQERNTAGEPLAGPNQREPRGSESL